MFAKYYHVIMPVLDDMFGWQSVSCMVTILLSGLAEAVSLCSAKTVSFLPKAVCLLTVCRKYEAGEFKILKRNKCVHLRAPGKIEKLGAAL